MELKKVQTVINALVTKYKYVGLVLLIGLALMLIPGREKATRETQVTAEQTPQISLQQQLESVLSQVAGVGQVRVMLNERTGQHILYQTNEDISVDEGSTDTRVDTVTVTDSARNEQGLIRQINPATYCGALILCQGAEDPGVRLAITDAVSKLTGLGADKIAILKMK